MTSRVALLAGAAIVAIVTGGPLASSVARAQAAPAAPTTLGVGDWQLAPVVEVRVRGEYRFDLDDLDEGMLLERARLGVDGVRGPVEARVVLQDARAIEIGGGLGPVAGPAPMATTGAYEAWVDAHTSSRAASYVRVGRQAVRWGEGRLLGTADWSPAGRSLDAVRGRLATAGGAGGDLAFEALGALLLDPTTLSSIHSYGELAGARVEWAVDPLFAVEAYALGRFAHDAATSDLAGSVRGETYTGALRLHGNGRAWDWGVEGAYQLGHAADLSADRRAYAAAAHVAREFEQAVGRPSVRAGAAYASGDEGKSTFGTFDPLLPDVHTWHGAMDLFAWSNEAEISAGATVAPWTDATASVEYRYARLAQAQAEWTSANLVPIGRAAAGNTAVDLGHEVDAALRWLPWSPVALAAGYSFFVLGDGAKAVLAANGIGSPQPGGGLRGPGVSHFAYAEVTVAVP